MFTGSLFNRPLKFWEGREGLEGDKATPRTSKIHLLSSLCRNLVTQLDEQRGNWDFSSSSSPFGNTFVMPDDAYFSSIAVDYHELKPWEFLPAPPDFHFKPALPALTPERIKIVSHYLLTVSQYNHEWIMKFIENPSLLDYAFFLHEITEALLYNEVLSGVFDPRKISLHYDSCHSIALLVEFWFLDGVRQQVSKHSISWHDLMRHHPAVIESGTIPGKDWDLLKTWARKNKVVLPGGRKLSCWNCEIFDFYREIGWDTPNKCYTGCPMECKDKIGFV